MYPKIYALENDNKTLHQRVTDLERLVSSQSAEIKSLNASKTALQERFIHLKKSAAQLESFRKNIVSMVEFGSGTFPGLPEQALSFLDTDSEQVGRFSVGSATYNTKHIAEATATPSARINSVTESSQKSPNREEQLLGGGLLDGPSFLDDKELKSFQLVS
jgi:uncharacterized coiled-coil protein SlyX